MAGRVSGWDDLLRKSEQQASAMATSGADFPPIKRSLEQLDVMSQQLRAKTSQMGGTSAETNAATRLMAREGLDADQLTRDLESFKIPTTYADALPLQGTTVEEYLSQLHQVGLVSAVQDALQHTVTHFDLSMSKTIMDNWQRQKRSLMPATGLGLVNSLSRERAAAAAAAAADSGTTTATAQQQSREGLSTASRQGRQVAGSGWLASGSESTQQPQAVAQKEQAYAVAVAQLNAALESGRSVQEVHAASLLSSAYASTISHTVSQAQLQHPVTMSKMWHLIQSLVGDDGQMAQRPPASSPSSSSPSSPLSLWSMLLGARRHLEAGHAQYLMDVVHSQAAEASLGGSTGSLQRVRAFLRLRLKGHGLLDFDAAPSSQTPAYDTSWHQVYLCLRSGFYDDALHVAQSSRSTRSFASLLADWISSAGALSPDASAAAADECERLLRLSSSSLSPSFDHPAAGFAPSGQSAVAIDRRRILLLVLLSGQRRLLEQLLRDPGSLLTTIEDFMWVHLAMVRDITPPHKQHQDQQPQHLSSPMSGAPFSRFNPSSPSSFSPSSPSSTSSGHVTLFGLQQYVQRFGPAYYTREGREPLVYAYVLLLSLQLQAALSYLLTCEPSDGVHAGIALAVHGALAQEDAWSRRGAGQTGARARMGGSGYAAPEGMAGVPGGNSGVAVGGVLMAATAVRQYADSVFGQAGDVRVVLEYCAVSASMLTTEPAEESEAAARSAGTGGGRMGWSSSRQQRRDAVMLEMIRQLLRSEEGIRELLGVSVSGREVEGVSALRQGGGGGAAGGGGGVGAGPSLGRFITSPGLQRQVALAAASDCQEMGLVDEAIALLRWARSSAAALRLVNDCLSDAILSFSMAVQAGGTDEAAAQLAAARASLGSAIASEAKAGAAAGEQPGGDGQQMAREEGMLNEELFILRELQAILRFFLDVGAGRFASAINHVAGLPFLPIAGRTPSSCAALLRQLPLAVDRLLAPMVLGLLHCTDCLPASDMSLQGLKSNIIGLVAATQDHQWPQELYRRAASTVL